MYNKSIFIIAIICMLVSKNNYAQNKSTTNTQQIKNSKKVFYSVGAGTAIIPEYEGSNNYRILPIVNFSANWINGRYIRINGLNTEFNLLKNRKWNFGPTLIAKINRGNDVSNEKIARLPELNLAIGAGIFSQYNFKKYFIKASYIQDITNVNNGGLANLEIGYNYRKNSIISRTSISTSFATEKYLNTYFGINEYNSINSNLNEYKLNSGFKDIGLNTSFLYSLNKKWMLGTALRYNILINEAVDSPIVKEGSKHQFTTAFFTLYRF